ncbi:MAG: alpha/beta hydrolase [Bryobacteraceae bacterium]
MIWRLSFCALLAALACAQTAGPKVEALWPGGAPGAVGNEEADRVELTILLPDPGSAVGSGVIICPGGGYVRLVMSYEGVEVGQWFNKLGVAAFVLKSRLGPRYHHPAPLQDAQRAIRMVRSRAAEFGVAPNRIGIMGFSAGGHLASSAGTHFDDGNPAAADPVERVSSRPDFLILGYPVITMDQRYTHQGSRDNLLGPSPDPKLVESMSSELQVTSRTPPAFLFHTTDDPAVPVENSVNFYRALIQAKVPAEMHLYQHGAHGVGLGKDPILATWPERLADWLRLNGWLEKR